MIRVFFLSLLLIANVMTFGQQADIRPGDTAFTAKYAKFDFQGNFAAVIEQDAMNNYYLLDFSLLPTRFERVYFMNLSFLSQELVNIDPEVSKNRVCYLSNRKYEADRILKILTGIKAKVIYTASTWTETEKAQWLTANDKYK